MVEKSGTVTMEDLISDKDGQIWCSPSADGTKRIAALQFQSAPGIENAIFIPYESCPKLRLSLCGRQGIATIGNLGEVEGRELRHLAIGINEKLITCPDTANFADLGYPVLDSLSMWRDCAEKKDTPAEFITW